MTTENIIFIEEAIVILLLIASAVAVTCAVSSVRSLDIFALYY